jgi:hypothetical protein
VDAALAVRFCASVIVAVTLCVVIEQSLVMVTATELPVTEPLTTVVPRTATT